MPSAEEDHFFRGVDWMDDDGRIDYYALFVLEDIPVTVSQESSERYFYKANARM
jgi:hypothetical protein